MSNLLGIIEFCKEQTFLAVIVFALVIGAVVALGYFIFKFIKKKRAQKSSPYRPKHSETSHAPQTNVFNTAYHSPTEKRAEPKKEEKKPAPKKPAVKKEEPKKEQPKKEEPKKEEPKVEEVKEEKKPAPKKPAVKKEKPKKEEPKVEEVKPVEEPKVEEPKVEEPTPAPAPVQDEPKVEEVKPVEEVKTEEPKEEQPKAEEPVKKTVSKKEEEKVKTAGKWNIEKKSEGEYVAVLYATNGQCMLTSEIYTTEEGARNGVATIVHNVENGVFVTYKDKNDNTYFKLKNSNNRLLCVGEIYKYADQCAKAIESVKRLAPVALINPVLIEGKGYVDYTPIANPVYEAKKGTLGKWIIETTDEGKFSSKLYASNGQLMLATEEVASKKSASNAIDSVKKNSAEGNFIVDRDKFGRFYYKLRNAQKSVICIGEAYESLDSCTSALESVRRFAATAVLAQEEKEEEPKKAEVKKEEPKKAETKKEQPKKEEVKKEEPKKADNKEETKKTETKKAPAKKATSKKTENK